MFFVLGEEEKSFVQIMKGNFIGNVGGRGKNLVGRKISWEGKLMLHGWKLVEKGGICLGIG